jgi:hypothetical protein
MMPMLGLIPVLALWLLQAAPDAALTDVQTTLQPMRTQLQQNNATFGVTAVMTDVKHRLRDWVDERIGRAGNDVQPRAVQADFHGALRRANLLCDECDSNVLGYVDDVRVSRTDGFLTVVTAMGTYCGYDESAYLYQWNAGRWQRIWAHEQNVDTPPRYLPQQIHDIQVSAPAPDGTRLLMELGSQTICGGSFKDLYARAWRLDGASSTKLLDQTMFGNDGYPPLLGRVTPNDVLFTYTADGFASGDSHIAVRRFVVDGSGMKQVDPVAMLPHDFVLEKIDNPKHYGDTAEPTRRCTTAGDWQVGTRLFEGPKRYYRVRWEPPFSFTLLGTSETPYADCTETDPRSDVYPDILHWRF